MGTKALEVIIADGGATTLILLYCPQNGRCIAARYKRHLFITMQAPVLDERLILVVDPNATHSGIIRQVLQNRSDYRLVILQDGITVLDFLHRRGEYANADRPHLILLDLDLPGQDGHELLTEIKSNPQLRRIPIIVLTTSNTSEDIFRSYAEQGNCYVIKATDSEQLVLTIQRIEAFWLEIVTLPQE
jgi:chemotaxis family two-component system response regulator Rcp1